MDFFLFGDYNGAKNKSEEKERMAKKAKIAIVTLGYEVYFQQFEG